MSLPIEEEEAVTDAPMTVDLYEGKVRTSRATRSKTTHISKTSDVADGGDEVISVTTAAGAGVEQGLAILGANTHEISSQSLEVESDDQEKDTGTQDGAVSITGSQPRRLHLWRRRWS